MRPGLRVEIDGRVATITLDRPERRNAITRAMARGLGEVYAELDADPAVRAIVLTGAGPAFCAGADLGGGEDTFVAPDEEFTASPVRPAAFEIATPVIAAINGHAIGIGLTLAMQTDIRLVAADAKYAIPQVRLGVMPDAVAHWTIPHIAGQAVAADVLLTGRTFDGHEAVRLGLASRVLPAAEVLPAATAIARTIATYVAPRSAQLTKRLLWDVAVDGLDPAAVADRETTGHREVMGGADAAEGVRAMLERRTPRWAADRSAGPSADLTSAREDRP